jgi:pilus assembly protein Flp/PilA
MPEGRSVREGAMKALLGRFGLEERGATAIEYGLIGGLVFLAIVTSVNSFSSEIHALFRTVETAVVDATP